MKTLIVEDEFVSRAKLQKILSAFGECDVAVNGLEGLEAFKAAMKDNTPYDLICMDILMPEMDGQEALKKIREFEKERGHSGPDQTKVIMTSGLRDSKNVMKAFMEGKCEAYLPKPFEKEKLLAQLNQLGLLG